MTSWTLANCIGALLVAWSILKLQGRAAYVCPACGSKRADGHTEECPWKAGP
jgi:hypothetical protein